MVSSVRKYYSFKDLNYFLRKPFMSFILIVLILIVVLQSRRSQSLHLHSDMPF